MLSRVPIIPHQNAFRVLEQKCSLPLLFLVTTEAQSSLSGPSCWGPDCIYFTCVRDDRKRESSKMAKAFRYTKRVVFNVGLSVLFLMEQSIIERAKISLENTVYIFYLWEILNKTCLYYGPGINSDLPWTGDWPPGCLKPSQCSGNGPVTGGDNLE